jgi:enterobacterial common antigen flippase
LTAVADNNQKIAHEVNTQTEIGLLLAIPALAFTLVFAPVIIPLFYSGKFDDAIGVLRWAVFGVFGKIVTWPLGYVMYAKGRSKTTLWVEILCDSVWLLLTWVCVRRWGLNGSGMAFAFLFVFSTCLLSKVVYSMTGTTWTRSNRLLILSMGLVLVGIATNCHFSPILLKWVLNFLFMAALSFYCLRRLSRNSGVTLATVINKLRGNPKSRGLHFHD